MKLEWLTPQVNNYRGQCIGLLARSHLPAYKKRRLARQLPNVVSYDEYEGLYSILCSTRSSAHVSTMYNRLFRRFSLTDWFDGIFDFVDRLID